MRMSLSRSASAWLASAAMLISPLSVSAEQSRNNTQGGPVQHVLLISVDGMHAVDLTNYVATHPNSTFAWLETQGVTYENASTSDPSDSFPGLAALVTGATPNLSGLWYDDSYNRTLIAPSGTGAACPGTPGTEVQFAENIDINQNALDGGGGIDTTQLPRDPKTCAVIYPHQYLRVNTIFNVAHNAGMYTAWSDKHQAYEWVKGPKANGVDDLFTCLLYTSDAADEEDSVDL